MPSNRDQLKDNILQNLLHQIERRNESGNAERLSRFTRAYYRVSPVEELNERSIENLYGATLSIWNWLQSWKGDRKHLRVFNPELETQGWHCSRTVIQLIQENMPFIVDTVRLELNRRGVGIHVVHSCVIDVKPTSEGVELADSGRGEAVTLLYIEIDRSSDPDLLKEIADGIGEALDDLAAAVDDYPNMVAQATELAEELQANPDEDYQESAALLRWMVDNHFTFLGYDCLSYTRTKAGIQLKRDPGTELGILKIYAPRGPQLLRTLTEEEAHFRTSAAPSFFAKDYHRSRVHRPAYQDIVVIKRFNARGVVVGEHRFFGLYTSPVYVESPGTIPVVRKRLVKILEQTGFKPGGHGYKSLLQTFVEMPRDELMLSTEDELFVTVMGIFNLQERRKVRLLSRRDVSGNFYTFLYYVPRDIFHTRLRSQVQELLCKRLGVEDSDFTTYYSESILTRVYFVLPSRLGDFQSFDPAVLEEEVAALSRSWEEELHDALLDQYGEERGTGFANLYQSAFPAAYREHFQPAVAARDVEHLEKLAAGDGIRQSFYRQIEQSGEILRFKLFAVDDALVLSDVIPILENLGMRVIGEHPYRVTLKNLTRYWIHDFSLEYQSGEVVDLDQVKALFQDAFASVWSGAAESDGFNRLVIGAHLSWREVSILRAYARYNQQIRFGFSQHYIAQTLTRHLHITRLLVALFRARFEPNRQQSDKVQALSSRLVNSIQDALERVENLNDDKILRRYLELILATLRTNYYRCDAQGQARAYLSFKIDPHAIEQIPLPRPMFEIFVYSPQVEGVHLRGGRVARGGLRWSDRLEDYRTEVLGLVKAQQVKNAVIVPVGAKGGFVAKTIPVGASRDQIQSVGIEAYKTFISGLLDLTDNLVAGEVVPPEQLVRLDSDDPYLVVAADKGTATFSDIANQIAADYQFWLGDAFASGGSQGYDHKKMGITARGAWESVKLHFRERGIDIQTQPFSVIGIGDMSGDVFGNGMLLSEQIRLLAAFNHQHIFIDPDPDPASSYVERQRLFNLPRSGWNDYDSRLISAGGGVFARSAKWIELSPQMRERFAIDAERLAPADLISALLRAPVDLLWNGGIGTYVKASSESHADVGDKANDSLRVDACQLRAKVIGEGGNLGFTQLARVEFARAGGACNTDFIDNAGGVDCSDHEVNIKIALQAVVQAGDLTLKQRNRLLSQMTDRVAELVLENNYRQAQALALAELQISAQSEDYNLLIRDLEQRGRLSRKLEYIPDDEQLEERNTAGQYLTRPELSVLISYVKGDLKEQLNVEQIATDPKVSELLFQAFPEQLVDAYREALTGHRLQREIIATQLANTLVNQMGIIFPLRVAQATGRGMVDIALVWSAAREIFAIDGLWSDLEALDNQVETAVLHSVMADIQRLMRRVCVWILRQYQRIPAPSDLVERFQSPVRALLPSLAERLSGEPKNLWLLRYQELLDAGVPEDVAYRGASLDSYFALLDIASIAAESDEAIERVGETYFELGELLSLYWLEQYIKQLSAQTRWQIQAREVYREDLNIHQYDLTLHALQEAKAQDNVELSAVQHWNNAHQQLCERWFALVAQLQDSPTVDASVITVALRELEEMTRAR